MSRPYLKSLADTSFDRPKKTYTESIQNKAAIKEKLKNYERVEDIDDVEFDTHVRYFTLDKQNKQVFRTGGLLIKKHSEYVKLSNGRMQWSVQRYHYDADDDEKENPIFETVFFARISKQDEFNKKEEKYIAIIKKQRDEINKLKDIIKKIQKVR
tara:strand:- start:503 stop:967 length:465 start_codon:yes stop_codon:yes gene_type:complete